MPRHPAFCVALLVYLASVVPQVATAASDPEAPKGFWLTTDYPSVTVRAGDTADIALKLSDFGVAPAEFKLAVEGLPQDWKADFTGGGRTVAAAMPASGDSLNLDLHVTVPATAKAETQNLVVAARSGSDALQLPLDITVGNVEPAKLEIKTDLPSLKGSPSTSFDYSFSIKNASAKKQTVSLSAETPQNFQASFTEGYSSQEISSIPIDPGQSKDLKVKVQGPSDMAAGKYNVKVTAAAGEMSADLPLAMEITGQPHLRLSGKNDRLSAEAEAGKASAIDLVLSNDGSAPAENVGLSASPPGEWNVSFDNKTIQELAPGESHTVVAWVTPSAKALAGDYMTTFRAASGGASSSADFRVAVTTSTLWGVFGVALIAVALLVLVGAVARFGRR